MILIAESGSTKTDWVLLSKKGVTKRQQTLGINPFHQNISSIINNISSLDGFHAVNQVFFYGAGCAIDNTKQKVKNALLQVFPDASCEINSDILAAARSLCGVQKGIACIIGTGSNSCLYNGESIEHNVRPLGYILGDEGSGAVMGKKLIADLLKGIAPEEIKSAFYQKYDLKYAEIIHKIYSEEAPSRFLAQFTIFLSEQISNPYVSELIQESFIEFFERNIKQYENCSELPIHFTGSIAYYFKDQLQQAAIEKGLTLGKILKSPLEGLIQFHSEN
ncbi:ATPase [Ancylomarina longa]|uniref:ATPase n=1 Tax=Ancylomarina longa TaxID=2487017 RepID=A0A434AFF5_9BACT|nr:ATPase [Ancylomarina longa]RUT73100.1 ATPase [Ancylomarina longa]